jgi:hypothetical protein
MSLAQQKPANKAYREITGTLHWTLGYDGAAFRAFSGFEFSLLPNRVHAHPSAMLRERKPLCALDVSNVYKEKSKRGKDEQKNKFENCVYSLLPFWHIRVVGIANASCPY